MGESRRDSGVSRTANALLMWRRAKRAGRMRALETPLLL